MGKDDMLKPSPWITIPQPDGTVRVIYSTWACSKGHQGQIGGNAAYGISFGDGIEYCYECYNKALRAWAAANLGAITITPAERPKR